MIKNLSKEPIEYDEQSNIPKYVFADNTDMSDGVTMKSKNQFCEKAESHVRKIKLNKSEELLSKAKELNNKNFTFKLRGQKSQSNLQLAEST